jgi:hypothetical protein
MVVSKINEIKEGETIIWNDGVKNLPNKGIVFKEIKGNYVVLNIGSGYYWFSVQY